MFQVGYEDFFHLVLFFVFCYHLCLLFLVTKTVVHLDKRSESVLQPYSYPAFQHFMVAHNYVSDGKGNIFLLNLVFIYYITTFWGFGFFRVKTYLETLNNELWLK